MRTPPRRFFRARPELFPACVLLPAVLLAAAPPPKNTETRREDKLQFELLPRSFQRNPLLGETVVTEMSEAGRKLPAPSPANPVYYAIESGGYRAAGNAPDDRQLPSPEEIAALVQRALAVNGYQPADATHPPTLLMVYFWGAHSDLERGSGDQDEIGFTDASHQHLLTRAALVGGTQFARELGEALKKQDREDEVNKISMPANLYQYAFAFGPLNAFTGRDAKTRQLWNATCGECYYAVTSAYDYAAASQGQRRLLWRTRMTVDSRNVTLQDTLPGLILEAGKYFGVDMPEAATLERRLKGNGNVKLGPLEVDEYLPRPGPAPDQSKPAGDKKF